MDALQWLESSATVAPPDEETVQASVDLVLADAFREGGARDVKGALGSGRHRIPRRRGALVGVAAMIATAAGTTIPLAFSGGPAAAAPVLKLSSYSLRLPRQYRLTSAVTSPCRPWAVFTAAPGGVGGVTTPSYASADAAAATAAGGCLLMVLAPPYTPTASQPDPEDLVSGTQPARVGPYNAYVRTGSVYYLPATGQYGPVETTLYVEIPLAGGQVQDLVVGAEGLSQSQLLLLVANGLSVPPASVPTSTAGSLGTAGSSGAEAS